jgi:hypothetical protein
MKRLILTRRKINNKFLLFSLYRDCFLKAMVDFNVHITCLLFNYLENRKTKINKMCAYIFCTMFGRNIVLSDKYLARYAQKIL